MAGFGLRWQYKAWRQVTQGFASVGFAAMGQSKKEVQCQRNEDATWGCFVCFCTKIMLKSERRIYQGFTLSTKWDNHYHRG